jgi:hypothetical protein
MNNIDSKLEYIKNKFQTQLENYKFINNDETCNINPKSYIIYIKKSNLNMKKGYVKEVRDKSIIELINYSKKITWFIYTKDYYIFVRISYNDKLKNALKDLVNSDFIEIRNKINITKLNKE